MKDTATDAHAIQTSIHQRLGGVQRLATALEMSVMMRELSAARLRREHPDWSARQITRELLRYAFGRNTLPPPLR